MRAAPCSAVLRIVPAFLLLAACGTPARLAHPDVFVVVVDGRRVSADERSLLQLLHCCVPAARLGEGGGTAAEEPIVLVDGVRVLGVKYLADIPAFHAEHVEILRASEAVPIYGARAHAGAIVVTMRKTR